MAFIIWLIKCRTIQASLNNWFFCQRSKEGKNQTGTRSPGDPTAVVRNHSRGTAHPRVSRQVPTHLQSPDLYTRIPFRALEVSGLRMFGGLAYGGSKRRSPQSTALSPPVPPGAAASQSRPGSLMTRAGGWLGTWGRSKDPPAPMKLANERVRITACRVCPPVRLRHRSQCQRGKAVFHSPNEGTWGSTAKAAIAATIISPRTLPIFKNGGNTPHGSERATWRAGVTSGYAPHWTVGAGAAILEWAKAFAQTQPLPESVPCGCDETFSLDPLLTVRASWFFWYLNFTEALFVLFKVSFATVNVASALSSDSFPKYHLQKVGLEELLVLLSRVDLWA